MKHIGILLFALIICSCQEKYNHADILGKWKTISWTEKTTERAIDHTMNFDFKEGGRYTVDYGSYLEEGKYWISGDVLFTKEDDKAQKKVRILTLTPGALSIEMNRSGNIEQVVLGR